MFTKLDTGLSTYYFFGGFDTRSSFVNMKVTQQFLIIVWPYCLRDPLYLLFIDVDRRLRKGVRNNSRVLFLTPVVSSRLCLRYPPSPHIPDDFRLPFFILTLFGDLWSLWVVHHYTTRTILHSRLVILTLFRESGTTEYELSLFVERHGSLVHSYWRFPRFHVSNDSRLLLLFFFYLP